MIVGVPKEVKRDEYRVAMLPVGVAEMTRNGHRVLLQRGAGVGSGLPDQLYHDAGAQLVDRAEEVFGQSEMVIKVKEPQREELPLLRRGQTLFTYFHFAADRQLTEGVFGNRRDCRGLRNPARRPWPIAAPDADERSRRPHEHSGGGQVFGTAADGRGILLGGVPGVAPANILILGGGVVGANAAKVAAGFGANISLLDVNMDRLRYLDDITPANVDVLFSDRYTVREYLKLADLVIGAVLIPGAKRRTSSSVKI